jgi:hypothetical protein
MVVSLLATTAFCQSTEPPVVTDGNALLSSCTALIEINDSRQIVAAQSSRKFTASLTEGSWCSGYFIAMENVILQLEAEYTDAVKAGAQITGPEKARNYLLNSVRIACIPDTVYSLQLARITVKWLKEHPERLHQPAGLLTLEAIKNAFPCK